MLAGLRVQLGDDAPALPVIGLDRERETARPDARQSEPAAIEVRGLSISAPSAWRHHAS